MLVADRAGQVAMRKYRERLQRDVRDGAMAGVLAGAGVMVAIFGFDLLFFEPLTTPEFLISAMLGGDNNGDAAARLRAARIAIFSLLHMSVFSLLGIVLARFFSLTALRKTVLAGGAFGLIICTIVFSAGLQVTGTHMSQDPGWWGIIGANVLAGVIMVTFLRVVQGARSG